jgi:3'(2'), 5'-bisphosphate nucleotidase
MEPRTVNDAALARSIADEAGALLRALCVGGDCSAAELGQRGDREANALILARLAAERPDDFVLSEEAADDQVRCGHRRVWIVDPLDGTREFSGRREDWAVHIGLTIDGRPVDGAVALPMLGRTLATDALPALPPLSDGPPRMLVSRTRCAGLVTRVGEALGAELVPMGSAGAKAMAVLEGRAEIYLHAGGQYEWDNCAPVAVAKAAGLHASRIDGSEIVYNCRDPLVPDLLICRTEWAERALAAVRDLVSDVTPAKAGA